MILHLLTKNWTLFLVRGVLAILFGLLVLAWPGLALLNLILLYGAFAFADGVTALIAAIRGGSAAPRRWLAIAGIAGITIGTLTFLWPGATGLMLLWFIAGWAIITGVMQIIGAIELRKEIDNEWFLIAVGVLSVVFGASLLVHPGEGALALAYLIGIYAVVCGVLFIAFSMRLRRHGRTVSSMASTI